MKLKKTWMGICVWVLYLVLIIGTIQYTCLHSGLFPDFDIMKTTGFSLLVVAAGLVFFVFKWICDFIREKTDGFFDRRLHPVVEVLIPIALIAAVVIVYSILTRTVSISGNIGLYEKAVVTQSAIGDTAFGTAQSIYVAMLHMVMQFTGNTINAAPLLNVILAAVSVLFFYIALRLGVGVFGAIVGCGLIAGIPALGYSTATITELKVVCVLAAITLLLMVIFARNAGAVSGQKLPFLLFDLLVGAVFGFSFYVDPGIGVVLVLLIAAFFIDDEEKKLSAVVINGLALILTAVIVFALMLTGEHGSAKILVSFMEWVNKFGHMGSCAYDELIKGSDMSTLLCFCLIAAASFFIYGYFRKRDSIYPSKAVPFIVVGVLGLLLGKLSEATFFNTQEMYLVSLVILIAAGASCITHDDGSISAREEEEEDKEESETVTELVAKPLYSTIEPDDAIKEEKESEPVKEEKITEEKPRFVPEGMVLPVGEEDEEDIVPNFNMKRPAMEDIGVIELSRKPAKDDFDIDIEDGDDFDI